MSQFKNDHILKFKYCKKNQCKNIDIILKFKFHNNIFTLILYYSTQLKIEICYKSMMFVYLRRRHNIKSTIVYVVG